MDYKNLRVEVINEEILNPTYIRCNYNRIRHAKSLLVE